MKTLDDRFDGDSKQIRNLLGKKDIHVKENEDNIPSGNIANLVFTLHKSGY